MPQFNSATPGDDIYPQYNVTISAWINKDQAITKGHIYTMDTDKNLVAVTGATNVADLSKGIFQAKESVTAPDNDDEKTVQVLALRSRLLLKVDAVGIGSGDYVDLKVAGTTVTADTVTKATIRTSTGFLGRVFSVWSRTAVGGLIKNTTAAGETVLVDVLGA